MDRLWDEYDDGGRGLFFEPTVRREAWPRVNLYDKGSTLALHAELPGFEDKDVELTINQDVLTVRGERKPDAPERYAVHRQERIALKFARSFTLPVKVDAEKTTATLRNGVLTITMAKAAESQPKQIAVRGQ